MALVISELILEVERSEPLTGFADYGLQSEESQQKLIRDLEVAEERNKRLQLD